MTVPSTKAKCTYAPATASSGRITLEQAAEAMSVSVRSVKYARELRETGREDICAQVAAGNLSLRAALQIAKPEKYGPKPKDGLRALKKAWAAATPEERKTFLLTIGGGA